MNHPNIAHVYEIGESDGTHFIAMEFIDGETLRKKIHEEGIPLPKLLKYLNQVAEGLSKAHEAPLNELKQTYVQSYTFALILYWAWR